jgi:hypothetical protein
MMGGSAYDQCYATNARGVVRRLGREPGFAGSEFCPAAIIFKRLGLKKEAAFT